MPKRLLLVLALTLMSGCGFEFRTGFEIPSVLSQLSIEGGDRGFNEQLVQRLQQSGSVSVKAGDAATLFISKIDYQRRVRATDAQGLAVGYDYTYTIDYEVRDNDGVILLPLATISQQTTLDYDADQVLQTEAEEAFLKRQMEQDIIASLLRRMSRI